MKTPKALSMGLVVIVVLPLFVANVSAAEGLRIEKAVCGAKNSWRDVTAFLQDNVKGGTLSANLSQPFEEIGGDPAPGQVKNLIIDYRLNGTQYRLSLEEQFPVAFTIQLPAPEAAAPGADPRVSELMAEARAALASDVSSLRPYLYLGLACLACAISLLALVCAGVALAQIRQIKKQLGKSRSAS